jgi:hypothetical protein
VGILQAAEKQFCACSRNRVRSPLELWQDPWVPAGSGARLQRNAERIDCPVGDQRPSGCQICKCFRESSWFNSRKTTAAVIEKYRHGFSGPSAKQDQINRTILIHIAGFKPEAARSSDEPNGPAPGGRKLQLNPIIGCAGVIGPGFDAGKIKTKIPVEIGDCKRQALSNQTGRRILNNCLRAGGPYKETKKRQ